MGIKEDNSAIEKMTGQVEAKVVVKSLETVLKALPNLKANKDGTVTVTKEISFRSGGKEIKEDYYPTEQELADIVTGFSLIKYVQSDFYVFTMLAADLQVDRQYEHFLLSGLAQAAIALKGKPWLFEPHIWTSSNEIGRILDTWVEDDDKLMLKVFIRNSTKNADILDNIFAGVHSGVSIGFTSNFADMICDSCSASGKNISIFDENRCGHQPGTYDEHGNPTRVSIAGVLDGFEVSGAPVPAQRPSHILNKSFENESILPIGEKSMSVDNKELVTEEVVKTEEVKAATEEVTELQAAGEVVDPAETEEEVVLVEQPAEVVLVEEVNLKTVTTEDINTLNKDERLLESTANQDKSETADTIKSESSIIKDSSCMKDDLDNDQKEEDVKKKDMDTLGADADDEDIEKNPMSGKEPPLWSVELKTMISDMSGTLTTIKSGMEGLVSFAEQSKAVLSRYTTPEDGSDPEWEIRTVKQQEIADAQAKVLEGLVEKTMIVLDAISTDGKKEVKPMKNEWAQKLAKKLVSGENK